MVLDGTMFHDRNLAATWLDQAQRNNLLTAPPLEHRGGVGREGGGGAEESEGKEGVERRVEERWEEKEERGGCGSEGGGVKKRSDSEGEGMRGKRERDGQGKTEEERRKLGKRSKKGHDRRQGK